MLSLSNITAGYGPVQVLRGINLTIAENQLIGLLGANGSGKSTLLKVIAGLVPPTTGSVTFRGRKTSTLPPHQIARLGIRLSPQHRGVFPNLSVRENLLVGLHDSQGAQQMVAEVRHLFPFLDFTDNRPAGILSGGEQQALLLARTFLSNPVLLLLDEPLRGLATDVASAVVDYLEAFCRKPGNATVMVHHQIPEQCRSMPHYVLRRGITSAPAPWGETNS